ncbi:cyclic peptide export ABC transporter [uncultured Bradyrhizobium sp.]|uniref:cyclic peptide export ABC transporter n=1 Tax=uncultured Bradyrhizobium sp. TaxID=199684 RepID=UPI0035CC38B0
MQLLQREARIKPVPFIVLAALSGLSSAAVLAIINTAASNVATRQGNLRFLLLFGLAIAIFAVSQRHLMIDICRRVEEVIHRMRVRLIERARHAELLEIEQIGRSEIYACLSRETQTLAQAAPSIVIAMQSAVLVICTMLYIATLSGLAFVLSLIFTALGAFIHRLRNTEVKRQLRNAYERENELVERLIDMLDGFKEVKMSTARAREVADRVESISAEVAKLKTRTQTLHANDFVISQVTFFLLTGMMVFVVPALSPTYIDVVVKTTTATLFMIGPISNVVGSIPIFGNANAAADAIMELETRMARLQRSVVENPPPFLYFRQIKAEALEFSYPGPSGEPGFKVGPVDLTIRRGSTVFITGGNGSGKTTLMLMLLGLYPPHSGMLHLDDEPVGPQNVNAYRNLFSVVFSDNHLFGELFGIETIDRALAAELFELLEMNRKTELNGRAFGTTQLSGGQRKRLALIAALLEKRPICFFDEWAADQDPHFREKFYRVVLPRLKADGITIIAVTHDDKYFDVADLHLHMEEGKIASAREQPGASGR